MYTTLSYFRTISCGLILLVVLEYNVKVFKIEGPLYLGTGFIALKNRGQFLKDPESTGDLNIVQMCLEVIGNMQMLACREPHKINPSLKKNLNMEKAMVAKVLTELTSISRL